MTVVAACSAWNSSRVATSYLIMEKNGSIFGWVFFLILLGSVHVRPIRRACGEPNEIELTPIGVTLDGS